MTLSKIKIWKSSKYLRYLSQGKIGEAKPEVKSLAHVGADQEAGDKARTRQMGPWDHNQGWRVQTCSAQMLALGELGKGSIGLKQYATGSVMTWPLFLGLQWLE